MSTNVNKSTNEYFLTQAQYEARKTAGTLEVGAVYHITDVSYENTSNKVTSITSSSTNTQYPSAKCVYDSVSQLSQDKVDKSAIVTEFGDEPSDDNIPSEKLVDAAFSQFADLFDALAETKIDKDDIQTSVTSSSTDAQVPSAKLFYDTVGTVEATLNAIRGVS